MAAIFNLSRLRTWGGRSPHLPTRAVQYGKELTLSTNNTLYFHPVSHLFLWGVCVRTRMCVCPPLRVDFVQRRVVWSFVRMF